MNKNVEQTFSRFQICSQLLSNWHESMVAWICRRKKRSKKEVVVSDLLVILIVQQHNFDAEKGEIYS